MAESTLRAQLESHRQDALDASLNTAHLEHQHAPQLDHERRGIVVEDLRDSGAQVVALHGRRRATWHRDGPGLCGINQ